MKYHSSGTGYASFQINAYDSGYRIFSDSEWSTVSDQSREGSPGFYIVNETDWPIFFSID